MTPEGVVMILILCLATIKFFQRKLYKGGITSVRNRLISKSSIEPIVLFILTTIAGSLITNLIIGLILLNSIAWVVFHLYLRSLGYSVISWLSLLIFWLYAYATYITFESVPFSEIWYYTLFSWEVALIFLLVYDVLGRHIKIFPSIIVWCIASAVFLLPLIFIIYKLSFNSPIRDGQLNAIYQTDYNESLEFLDIYISPAYLTLLLGFVLSLLAILLYQGWNKRKEIENNTFFLLTVGLIILANLDVVQNLKLPQLLMNSAENYATELALFKNEQQKRKIGEVNFEASKENDKELYIIIIGESLNKNHMSLYGYQRNTTPELDKLFVDSEIIKFEEAFSNHVHTVPVLVQSLTWSNQQNEKEAAVSPSLLDIFEKADFDTYWISNQVAYSSWDNPVSILAERADHRINFNINIGNITGTTVLDERLAKKMETIISKGIEKNTAIFIHLMGNHFDYRNRYSRDYKKYDEDLFKKYFGKNEFSALLVNAYDNSVLYNDYVISKIIKFLQNRDGISSCLYFADHSEEVLENLGHNQGNFTFNMIEIPLIMWFSEAYKTKYPEKFALIESRDKHLFSNDLIYETVIGMAGVSTDQYTPQYDLFNKAYDLSLENCYTLHRKRMFNDPDNIKFFQRRNLLKLDSLNLTSKYYPHRVNSVGKLSKIFHDRSHSFEVDVLFRSEEDSIYFEVGHDEKAVSKMSLEEMLSYTNVDQIQKIWLDVKNLNSDNLPALKKRLIELDIKFNLKAKAIVESSITDPEFSELATSGFHTSYYLPTNIKDTQQNEYNHIANRIAQQVKDQQVRAVSFDIVLYSFVKNHLEPIIPEHVVYHTWDLGLQLKQAEFIEKLMKRTYFNDPRIKSVLIGYQSDFEL